MFTIDFSKDRQALGGLDRCGALCELPGVSSTKFRCSITPAHRVGAARELGGKQGLVIAERQILNSDHTRAVADVRNWTARIYLWTEKALNYRSARETDISVVGGLFAESGDAVSTRGAHLSERAARWPPRMHGEGANAQRNQPHRLMAWGVSASAFPQPNLAGERRLVNTQNSQRNSGNYIFLFFCRRLPTVPLEEDSCS
ncbi:putative trans-sialidase, partial [Trypanosoma cruzi]